MPTIYYRSEPLDQEPPTADEEYDVSADEETYPTQYYGDSARYIWNPGAEADLANDWPAQAFGTGGDGPRSGRFPERSTGTSS